MHKVIIIPGLGDQVAITSWVTKNWRNHNLMPIVYPMLWRDGEVFQTKLERLLAIIDKQVANRDKLSIIGCSAGASAALNVFYERKDKINKVISVCGRLNTGTQTGFRSLESRAKSCLSFKQSVKLFEARQELLSNEDRKRIMTITAKFGDELVPANTSMLSGACNVTIPTIEHTLSIYAALTIFSRRLLSFLTDTNL